MDDNFAMTIAINYSIEIVTLACPVCFIKLLRVWLMKWK